MSVPLARAPRPSPPDSALGRLLQELSWVGRNVAAYRTGGLGYENVLTTEAMMGLDFLPRQHFLGAVVAGATGADTARSLLVEQIEQAQVVVLPEESKLRPSGRTYQQQVVVQADCLITAPGCYALVEAKRIRSSVFQPEQLAREYVTVMQEASNGTPLLLLILGSEPPVLVKGHGRLSIEAAVALHLESVLAATDDCMLDEDELLATLPEVLAWTTWHRIGTTVATQLQSFTSTDPSVVSAVGRLADSVTHAVLRHS